MTMKTTNPNARVLILQMIDHLVDGLNADKAKYENHRKSETPYAGKPRQN